MKFEEFRRELKNLEKFAQGWRGVIYTGEWEGRRVSVKVAKSKDVLKAINKEAQILEKLKGIPGFPQILTKGEDFFVYEFIEGKPLGKVDLTPEQEKKVLRTLLTFAYMLDNLGINRDEFAQVYKNALLDNEGKVYLLDFERGKFSKRPSNVPQFLQLLYRKGYLNIDEAVELGRRYMRDREGVFTELMAKLE
ncbi:putative serine/threonine protein kinase [Hydrogenivirga caldilitoris]|uniref:Putative serine/threonine protein kinase n=1 Tax=Hydrogenivirga caldilitoris TaxID=246264 RepID=A0A497XQ05_9AQUI|nr:hypothetical protein [Hydrogenivirga caldilitoris]RLJ70351.1 putative serine/threonine protein kinase [Hydrogenivirga caldilitoris]